MSVLMFFQVPEFDHGSGLQRRQFGSCLKGMDAEFLCLTLLLINKLHSDFMAMTLEMTLMAHKFLYFYVKHKHFQQTCTFM